MSTSFEQIEAALLAAPDDAAAHAAYADALLEAGDPRGEYIRLLLALEERNQLAGDLDELHDRVRSLEELHQRDWHGPLRQRGIDLTLRRSWIESVRIRKLTQEILDVLIALPAAKLLRELTVLLVAVDVRTVDAAEQLAKFLRGTPIDSLFLANWSLGDAGVEALVTPHLPPRLRKLSLRNCSITDDGAALLGRGGRQLDHLDLDGNLLSPIGMADLEPIHGLRLGAQRFNPVPRGGLEL